MLNAVFEQVSGSLSVAPGDFYWMLVEILRRRSRREVIHLINSREVREVTDIALNICEPVLILETLDVLSPPTAFVVETVHSMIVVEK
jgi:hypothetical protein